jgi:hypothetical protein
MEKLGKSFLDHPGAYIALAIGAGAVLVIWHFVGNKGTVETGIPYDPVPTPQTGSRFDIPGGTVEASDIDLFNSHTDTLEMLQGAIDRWEATKERFGW